jgi:hypothetical protein
MLFKYCRFSATLHLALLFPFTEFADKLIKELHEKTLSEFELP